MTARMWEVHEAKQEIKRLAAANRALAEAVRSFLALSDQQADEGRVLADGLRPTPDAIEPLIGYLDDWGPKIEANWTMLRTALEAFDGKTAVMRGVLEGDLYLSEPAESGRTEAAR